MPKPQETHTFSNTKRSILRERHTHRQSHIHLAAHTRYIFDCAFVLVS